MTSTEKFHLSIIDNTTNMTVGDWIAPDAAALEQMVSAQRVAYPDTSRYLISWSLVQVLKD